MGPSTEVSEELRLRQVHSYLSLPINGRNEGKSLNLSATKVTSPNNALTAFTQLVTYRLGAQRAIISLVDRDHQYFLAESTPNLQLGAAAKDDEDWLWVGCSGSTSRSEALCSQTIKSPHREDGFSYFVVPDLLDSPYKTIPYVSGAPHFRYYAGTPLISPEGFPVGSLFVIDDRPRSEELAEADINFLGIMAQNIMGYLNMQRESEDRKRIAIMSKGLAAFTEGLHHIPPVRDTGPSNAQASKIDSERRSRPSLELLPDDSASESRRLSRHKESTIKPLLDANGKQQTHASVLARASNLLRESLNVDFTVFLDATSEVHAPRTSQAPYPSNELAPGISVGKVQSPKSSRGQLPNLNGRAAAVLSFSTPMKSSSGHDEILASEFKAMDLRDVKHLLKKHPHGYLWSFDESGSMMSVEEDPVALGSESSSLDVSSDIDEGSPRSPESETLMVCFPGVRQLLYAPIYDPATSLCICACFAVSLNEVPVFTTDIEVAFTRAFLNNVAVEWDRIAISYADRQKSDFLSSISHEFRSPLHGILASTELLADSELDTSQRGLCDTIENCGQTLLNTVSHILDYSKVNDFHHRLPDKKPSFERSPAGEATETILEKQDNVSSIGLYSEVDVARICEAVVQTVCAGQPHDQATSPRKVHGSLQTVQQHAKSAEQITFSKVEVVLIIDPGDWLFICAPGAIQRILMNLVGNSLKYTKTGWVKVELRMTGQTDGKEPAFVSMVVSDSGIGISEDFLRHKLFSPFSQESTLSPGTGLGLSMVKKIVQTLQGEITIQSQLGQGTEVAVQIPIPTNFERLPSSRPTDSDSVWKLRKECPNNSVALYGFESELSVMIKESLILYTTEWYNFSLTEDIHQANFVIVDESSLDHLVSSMEDKAASLRIVVLRNASIKDTTQALNIDMVLKPIGPNRLAKSLLSSWSAQLASFAEPENLAEVKRADTGISSLVLSLSDGLAQLTVSDMAAAPGDDTPHPENKVPTSPSLILSTAHRKRPLHKRRDSSNVILPRNWQPHILCVDDNIINLKLLEAYLGKLGFTSIKSACDGLEAFNIVEANKSSPFEIIFMDLSMPVCDGFESTTRIRKLEKQRRKASYVSTSAFIIALTGQASNRDQDLAFASGVDHFITKPMSLSQLKTLTDAWELRRMVSQKHPD